MLASITAAQILPNVQSRLITLRKALEDIVDMYDWVSEQALADLEAAGFSQADAQAVQSAMADANAIAQLYLGGGLGSYTLPYNFSASQRQVIGPQ